MTPEKIDIQTPTSYATNWIVSMDGKTFTQKVQEVVQVMQLFKKECRLPSKL